MSVTHKAIKDLPSAAGQPWIKEGITYQQWHYRNRKRPQLLAKHSQNGAAEPMVTAEEASRDKILMNEFLDRFEAQPASEPMAISFNMARAIYDTLRADGH